MLLNNIELDVKTKCIEESKTQAKIAEELGTTPGYISRIVNSREQIVNKTFLSMMERLGYHVRLTYEKIDEAPDE
jgi:transcriptional regulator with XRE-family HTH domain